MTQHVKIAGVWKTAVPYVKAAGAWKIPDYVFNKQDGRWKTSYVKGGFIDKGWDDVDQVRELPYHSGGGITNVVSQPDGKLIILGGALVDNWQANNISRLNADYSNDTTFITNVGTGASSDVYSACVQSDGKIIIVGDFSTWNGTSVNRIVRLNSDGTRDTAFTTNTGTAAAGTINGVALQSDGKIIVVGAFTTWNGSPTINRIARLNTDGTRDTTFTTNVGTAANFTILQVAVQSDDKIIPVGIFTTWNGTSINRIARLNSDGTIDTAFTTSVGTGFNGTTRKVAIQSDGKIIVVGQPTAFNGTTIPAVARLNSNGTLDTAFNTNLGAGVGGSIVYGVNIQPSGKIIFGGSFSTYQGVAQYYFARVNSDGTSDTTFNTNIGTKFINGGGGGYGAITHSDGRILIYGFFTLYGFEEMGPAIVVGADAQAPSSINIFADGSVTAVFVQSDGKTIVAWGGNFNYWNNIARNRIIRLNVDGTVDTSFSTAIGTGPSGSINTIAQQADGKLVMGGSFSTWNGTTGMGNIVRLNTDLSIDTTFKSNTGTGATNGAINKILIQPAANPNHSQKILVLGAFTAWNGTTSVNRCILLFTTGGRDNSYNTPGNGANSTITDAIIQSDYKVVLVGAFTTWAGVTVGRIVRLNNDLSGSRDTTYTTNNGTGGNGQIQKIALQSDGKTVVGGDFTTWNAVTAINRLARIDSTGLRETTFQTNIGTAANNSVTSIYVHTDGRIFLGGLFFTWNGVSYLKRFIGLNSDGTLYTQFNTNLGLGFNNSTSVIVPHTNNKILLGGSFRSVNNRRRRFFLRMGIEAA
jgi:uncharacterized delta-60 repeat protein